VVVVLRSMSVEQLAVAWAAAGALLLRPPLASCTRRAKGQVKENEQTYCFEVKSNVLISTGVDV
jgi:hypothetical protein